MSISQAKNYWIKKSVPKAVFSTAFAVDTQRKSVSTTEKCPRQKPWEALSKYLGRFWNKPKKQFCNSPFSLSCYNQPE